MDRADLKAAYTAHVVGQGKFTRRHVINLADWFGVTPRRLVLECERQGLCRRGSWDWFVKNGGITRQHIAEVRADRALAAAERKAANG